MEGLKRLSLSVVVIFLTLAPLILIACDNNP